jgi:hypothetical protein
MASNPINGKRKVKSVGVGTNVQIAILDDAGEYYRDKNLQQIRLTMTLRQ